MVCARLKRLRAISVSHAPRTNWLSRAAPSAGGVKSLEQALGVTLFRRLPRSLVLTHEGETYLPSIQSAFDIISKATELTAPALRGRKLRLGIAPQIMKMAAPAVRNLRQAATAKQVVTLKVTDDIAELLNGKLDVLLRGSVSCHPGLHVDRLALAGVDGTQTPVVLLTHPGPCRMPRTSRAHQAPEGNDVIFRSISEPGEIASPEISRPPCTKS